MYELIKRYNLKILIVWHNQTLSFSRADSAKFFRTLNKRVNNYFKENNIKRTGNWQLWLKTIVMFAIIS